WGCSHCGWTGPEKGAASGNGQLRREAATYHDYTDADGTLLFQKVRNPPGSKMRFYCRRPDGNGGWINHLSGIDQKPLCRWPEGVEARAKDLEIAVAEGESDVNALRNIGIPATCNFDGAGKWNLEYSEQLRGAHLIVFNDHDAPGLAHADAVCRMSVGT